MSEAEASAHFDGVEPAVMPSEDEASPSEPVRRRENERDQAFGPKPWMT